MLVTHKKVNFRLVDISGQPIAFAFIRAELMPRFTNAYFASTLFPLSAEARTNQYGIGTLVLLANDALEMAGTSYLITLSFNGKSYSFLVRLTKDMPEVVDFEDLLDREAMQDYLRCRQGTLEEGMVRISGEKLWI